MDQYHAELKLVRITGPPEGGILLSEDVFSSEKTSIVLSGKQRWYPKTLLPVVGSEIYAVVPSSNKEIGRYIPRW